MAGGGHDIAGGAVGEEDLIGEAERDAVRPGAAHHGLVVVVAHGVLVGERLEQRHVALLHVEDRHGLAGVVRTCGGERRRIGRGDRRLEVVQAAGRVAPGDVLGVDRAVHLLVHLEELMDGVGRVGVIRHARAGHLERAGRQASTLVMRVSGPSVFGRPVPPVPNRNWSCGGRPGSPPGIVRKRRPADFARRARSGAAGTGRASARRAGADEEVAGAVRWRDDLERCPGEFGPASRRP